MKKFNRVLIKLSGEALAGESGSGFDEAVVGDVARQIRELVESGVQIGIVIGGGNFWRGRTERKIDRSKSDSIGMLATVMNCIYVSEIFRTEGMKTQVMTPFECGTFTKLFSKDEALKAFSDETVVFFGGGTGHPYFSTDVTMVLRAIEIDADCIFAAKSIDGVYDSDPNINPDAVKYEELHIEEAVEKKLGVIDLAASVLCMENKMPMYLFGLNEKDSIVNSVNGKFTGTKIIV